jgi:hypothetical protein
MKKSEFKELIKNSVKEALVEDGILKDIIVEVVKAVGTENTNLVSESAAPPSPPTPNSIEAAKSRQRIDRAKQRLLASIGESSYGGVDVFEGTKPLTKGGTPGGQPKAGSALDGVAPDDPGVDISSIMGNSAAWKQLV